jgi:hypothetical protein
MRRYLGTSAVPPPARRPDLQILSVDNMRQRNVVRLPLADAAASSHLQVGGSAASAAHRSPQRQLTFFTRAASRDTLLEAVRLCITPFCAARISSGSAALSAAWAAAASPDAIASSTLRR